ncbi:MAG: cellulase family glycosylhydrolase, partial [Candidatus Hydrogenedentes bacterium]|nr:cellulase family glycosylhydrolase [Candidatus Hydrogenedentota bacterium]
MNRRQFLRTATATTIAATLPPRRAPAEDVVPSHSRLPRWRGFNLLDKFGWGQNGRFQEEDFAWMAEWGFDFVRLPMSYTNWIKDGNWREFREDVFQEIDAAVDLGKRYGIHVCINFHRAPGYCVGDPQEATNLWKDEEPLEVCALHWAHFADRYAGIPSSRVSFDLVNEPAHVSNADYARVAQRLVEAIRAKDPNRLIIADGNFWGREPVQQLIPLQVAQSTRGYDPMQLTHYKAGWVEGADEYPLPEWPLTIGNVTWDKAYLRENRIEPWKKLAAAGVGVHVGEWGCFNQTPHEVALAWMKDQLELWQEAGFGWALWNFRGSIGVLDSDRRDVDYEEFHG